MTVAVALPSPIVYVAGTINRAQAEFERDGAVWRAAAQKAPDCRYEIELQAYDAAGNRSDYSTVMHYGIYLITDRTQSDAVRAASLQGRDWRDMTGAEKEQWQAGLRGAYNAEDMNRVGGAVRYLADLLDEAGYHSGARARTDWAMDEFPTAERAAEYLEQVERVRAAFVVLPGTPDLPMSMEGLTWREANAIEQNLQDIHRLAGQMQAAYLYSGEIEAEEG